MLKHFFSSKFPEEYQLDKMDCGATCLKIISKFYGRIYSLAYLREICGTTREGVSVLNIINGAEKIGLKARAVKTTYNELSNSVPLPCIIHWRDSHFIVVYRITSKRVYISDPSKGLISYSPKAFIKGWYQFNKKKGIVIGLDPEHDFLDINHDDGLKKERRIGFILRYFLPYKKNVINLLIIMCVVTGLQASVPFITRSIIDIGVGTSDVNFVNMLLFANIVILFAMSISNIVRDWIITHLTNRINISLVSDYLIKLMKLPITFFENKMIGDILQRASDHQRIRDFIMNNSLNLLFSSLTFVVFTFILYSFSTYIFLVFLGGSILYFSWIMFFLNIRKRLDTNYFGLMAKDQSYWVETISSMQDIKTNNYELAKRWKWENLQARLYKVNVKLMSITNYQNQGGQFIEGFKNIFITIICAKSVINGEMTFGVMISIQIIIGMLNAPIQQFIQFVISGQIAKFSLMRINEIHQLDNEEPDIHFNESLLPEKKDIIINNVSFQYAPRSPYTIKGVRFRVPEGKVTAIVGDSGSGKTTLLKLILRLYNPTMGDIFLGNLNIKNIPLKYWRDKCGVVLQDGNIFNDTILNNIVLGDEKIDYNRYKMAINIANIEKEIESMPKGYNTKMGEQGRGLSGGQKQRILIARALYKDPEFLFLDEATNSLDSINEQKIIEALNKVFKKRTVIVIAHRLSTIKQADQIIVMREGRVEEIGTHSQLMDNKGHYYNLIRTQFELTNDNE